ncbi:glycosyltransferase [Candidatus Woesearchaeota archaeon]|nr:glycosyltransferase [Candidatus Woesearchaeota archaeon]
MTYTISVIIPAHNEESQIAEALDSLTSQTCKNFEVIVVANGCTDGTAKIAQSYINKLSIKIFETKQRGIAFACNHGAKHSKAKFLFFLEADTVISHNGIAAAVNALNQGKIGGTLKMRSKEKKVWYRLGTKLLEFDEGAGWGPVRFCTAEVYRNIRGHNESIGWMIDADFAKRVKAQGPTIYVKDATQTTSMRRFEKGGFGEVIKQAYAYTLFLLTGKIKKGEYPVVR